jgi:thiol:disulfide interchange protein DsbC
MIKRIAGLCLLLVAPGLLNTAMAEPPSQAAIKKSLAAVLPGVALDNINPSPVDGVSEVQVGPRLLYVTNDGKYMLQGSLIDLETRVDVSEERRKGIRLDAINAVGEDNMIIFPASKPRHTVTVFTDIDCGYCRKLHNEIAQYNDNGITVRYMMFPRSGIDSPSYNKAVAVWCAKDHQDALTRSKAGEQLQSGTDCANPVKQHYELGQLIGVRGTPALVLDDGEMLPGYVPAVKLAKALDTGS